MMEAEGVWNRAMGLSLRFLVLDQMDRIYRLDATRFDQMRDSPTKHPLPQFIGQRVRSAEVVVELVERRPARVVRTTFGILTFDQAGCLEVDVLRRQQFARFASATAAQSGFGVHAEEQPGVRDARYLFDDRGGRWVPTEDQLRAIHEAAMGKMRISRL
jgi:hypothetical protein